jgi:hypothetical protein
MLPQVDTEVDTAFHHAKKRLPKEPSIAEFATNVGFGTVRLDPARRSVAQRRAYVYDASIVDRSRCRCTETHTDARSVYPDTIANHLGTLDPYCVRPYTPVQRHLQRIQFHENARTRADSGLRARRFVQRWKRRVSDSAKFISDSAKFHNHTNRCRTIPARAWPHGNDDSIYGDGYRQYGGCSGSTADRHMVIGSIDSGDDRLNGSGDRSGDGSIL